MAFTARPAAKRREDVKQWTEEDWTRYRQQAQRDLSAAGDKIAD